MPKMLLQPGLRPGPCRGDYSTPPDTLAGLNGRGGQERRGKGKKLGERKGKGREGGITVHLFPHFEP